MRSFLRGNNDAIVACRVFNPVSTAFPLATHVSFRNDGKATRPISNGTVLSLDDLQTFFALLHTCVPPYEVYCNLSGYHMYKKTTKEE